MDKKGMKNNQLIEQYLMDGLSEEEQAAFEEEFLSSQQLLDELEATAKLKQGLHDLAALDTARAPTKQSAWFRSMFQSPQYAMAASFLLVVSLGVSGVLLQERGRMPGLEALPTQITPLVSVRGTGIGESVNTLQSSGYDQNYVLMLDPGFSSYSHYRTAVFRVGPAGSLTEIWKVDEMVPGYEDMLALTVPAAKLDSGSFEVRIEGWRDEWPASHAWEPVDTLRFNFIE
jgi:hypothetical protein